MNNQLTALVNSDELAMSSLEIAELTGKRHDHVLADIRKMLTELYGEGGILKVEDTYRDSKGRTYPMIQSVQKWTQRKNAPITELAANY